LYNHATCFAFPSLYEGFGLPVLESFACGCPVVCFEAGAVKEVALDAAIVCTNLDEFTEGLRTVSCSSAISEVLREKGLLRVKDFSWHKCARETYSVYQRFS
jgi:glycosyltransferase involved in cell wall biosynthesis